MNAMTNQQLSELWDRRDNPTSGVVWWQAGHDKDSDSMTIGIDGGQGELGCERKAHTTVWVEVK